MRWSPMNHNFGSATMVEFIVSWSLSGFKCFKWDLKWDYHHHHQFDIICSASYFTFCSGLCSHFTILFRASAYADARLMDGWKGRNTSCFCCAPDKYIFIMSKKKISSVGRDFILPQQLNFYCHVQNKRREVRVIKPGCDIFAFDWGCAKYWKPPRA